MESEFDDLKAAMDLYIPDPRPGIEGRVLYRVRSSQRRRFHWIPIPALLLLLILFWPPKVSVVVREAPPRPMPVVGQALPPARLRAATVRKRLVRVQPFPTPTPLTAEEKALQALAASRPQEAQHLLAHADDKPIEIPELKIPPLQSDGGQ